MVRSGGESKARNDAITSEEKKKAAIYSKLIKKNQEDIQIHTTIYTTFKYTTV